MSDFDIKLCVLGETTVGKTALVTKALDQSYQLSDELKPTVGVITSNYKFTHKGDNYTVTIWDTAGQERFRSLAPMYYKGAQIVILCFTADNYETFVCAKSYWAEQIRYNVEDDVSVIYVLTKVDLEVNENDYSEEVEKYCFSIGCPFFETSAKTGDGIFGLLEKIREESVKAVELKQIVRNEITSTKIKEEKKSCC